MNTNEKRQQFCAGSFRLQYYNHHHQILYINIYEYKTQKFCIRSGFTFQIYVVKVILLSDAVIY